MKGGWVGHMGRAHTNFHDRNFGKRARTSRASCTLRVALLPPLSVVMALGDAAVAAYVAFFKAHHGRHVLLAPVQTNLVDYFKDRGVPLVDLPMDFDDETVEEEWRDYAGGAELAEVDENILIRWLRAGVAGPSAVSVSDPGSGAAAAVLKLCDEHGVALPAGFANSLPGVLAAQERGDAHAQSTCPACVFLVYLGRAPTGGAGEKIYVWTECLWDEYIRPSITLACWFNDGLPWSLPSSDYCWPCHSIKLWPC